MKNKVVLITGASSGIGQSTAKYLSKKGYRVFGTSRNPVDQKFCKMIKMDVTDEESVINGINDVLEETGIIDVLINNAGIGATGPWELMPIKRDSTYHGYQLLWLYQNMSSRSQKNEITG